MDIKSIRIALGIVLAVLIVAGTVVLGAGLGSDLNHSPYACQNAAGQSQLPGCN